VPPFESTACKTLVEELATLKEKSSEPSVVPFTVLDITCGVTPSNHTKIGDDESGSDMRVVKAVAYVGGRSLLDNDADWTSGGLLTMMLPDT
jgi:hypothetical protein